MEPEPPQDQSENELGDQEGLHHRHGSVVQGDGLEDERSGQRHPPEKPQRVGHEVADETPALVVFRVADAGNVLHDDVESIG